MPKKGNNKQVLIVEILQISPVHRRLNNLNSTTVSLKSRFPWLLSYLQPPLSLSPSPTSPSPHTQHAVYDHIVADFPQITLIYEDHLGEYDLSIRLWFFILFQWVTFIFMAVLSGLVSDIPEDVTIQLQRTEFLTSKVFFYTKNPRWS